MNMKWIMSSHEAYVDGWIYALDAQVIKRTCYVGHTNKYNKKEYLIKLADLDKNG